MNNKIFDIFKSKDKKRFEYIIKLIEANNFEKLYDEDHNDFGLENKKYIEQVLKRIEEEVMNNNELLLNMQQHYYFRRNYFYRNVIQKQPNIIETLIKDDYFYTYSEMSDLILLAIENGYNPKSEFINENFEKLEKPKVIDKLLELGYKPSVETIEKYSVFKEQSVFLKILDQGYIPTRNFLEHFKLPQEKEIIDTIFQKTDITLDFIYCTFDGNSYAQRKVINERPDLLLQIDSYSKIFTPIWIEAIKEGYDIEDAMKRQPRLKWDYKIFSRIIKSNPQLIKYWDSAVTDEVEKLYTLAIAMGYKPSIKDVTDNHRMCQSKVIMKELIKHRPEAIKYLDISDINDISDLARFSLECGYMPTVADLDINKKLLNSFDIMKNVIQDKPEMINQVNPYIANLDELVQISIDNGFNGDFQNYDILRSESALKYIINKTNRIPKIKYKQTYSMEMYEWFIEKGYKTEDIVDLFISNFDVMKIIIKDKPEYIHKIDMGKSSEIDELCLLAIESGYVPKFEDEIFARAPKSSELMIKKFPNYIEKVGLYDVIGWSTVVLWDNYNELCKIALDNGFIPNVENMGNGYGGSTTIKYNYNYEIMKIAIPQKPELIESCEVSDKEQYDELCLLALQYGYECTNEYALNHWGKKMKTNYNIMKEFIKHNPKLITEIDITNPDEIQALLDEAQINEDSLSYSGLLIFDSAEQKKILSLISMLPEDIQKKYCSSDYLTDLLTKASKMSQINDEVMSSLNIDFIKGDEITKYFTPEQIEILSCYPDTQKKIIHVFYDNFKMNIISKLVHHYKDNFEWILILEKALDNINSEEYINLLENLKTKELSDTEINDLIFLIISDNHLDISSYDELKNIENIREKYINMLIKRNTISSLKTAYLEKVFGIDLGTAIDLISKYGESLESDAINSLEDDSKTEFIILENIKKIINLNNIDILKYYIDNINPDFIVKPDLMITYESRLKYVFTKEFNKSFAKPKLEDKVSTHDTSEDIYDIYLSAGINGDKKFRMMITSIGAYTGMEEPDDYYSSWNTNKIASHGCCCSYVGEKNLGTAEIKYCCFGFTDYDLGSLLLSGPYDLCSFSEDKSYQVTAKHPSMYLLPDDVLNYTRHTHNETVWERRNIEGDGMFKKQPSYIVYFVDNFEDRLTNDEAKKQWEAVKKASSNFSREINGVMKPLPIMVVEREKIAQAQINAINEKFEQFKQTFDKKLMREIISDFESNYAGNRQHHINISEKYFPQYSNLNDSFVGKIIDIINNCTVADQSIIECIYELDKIVNNEKTKYDNTRQSLAQSVPSFNIEEALIEINKLKSKYILNKDSSLIIASSCFNNDRQYQKSDVESLNHELLNAQLSPNEVLDIIQTTNISGQLIPLENQIKEEGINSKLKIHGQRHIQNVMLYSALIGSNMIKDEHDLSLLLVSAKYHDIGRTTDTHEEHSSKGAEIVRRKLKDKYSSDELAIICTLIEFHEIPRDYGEQTFINIAKKNGIKDTDLIRVKELAEILKDADALDRTRFINKARLNPNFLKFDISKRLVMFASSMQETYSLEDLKQYDCVEEIDNLLKIYTPQEILRTIRHNTRGNSRIEVENYIRAWSETCNVKSGGTYE